MPAAAGTLQQMGRTLGATGQSSAAVLRLQAVLIGTKEGE